MISDVEFLNLLKVINDHTRLLIIKKLSSNYSICACKILEDLNITQGTLSHHMKALTSSGLVDYVKDGKWCHYYLNKNKFELLIEYLNQFEK